MYRVFQKNWTKFNAPQLYDRKSQESHDFHQNIQKLFDNTRNGKVWTMLLNILCLEPGKWTAQKTSMATTFSTNNIFNAIHNRNSLQQAQITGLMETMFKESTLQKTNNSR